MLEGLATSDWHFCGLAKHFGNHIERQLHELDEIYRYAMDNGVQHIFVPGDIADTPHMPYDVYVALVLFLRKYDGIINTYYIAGNHDFSEVDKTSMDLLHVLYREKLFETFHLYLAPGQLELDDVKVNMLPYPCLEAPASKQGALNFSHIEYNGAIGDNGRKLRTSRGFIQNPNDFNISGHIHTYQSIPTKNALYCGNPYQKNFGEALPKGFVHFKAREHKGKIQLKHKFVDNKPEFRLENVIIEKREDFARKLDKSDAYRYKIWVSPEVDVPRDLRVQYPNITGGIFDLDSKKRTESDEEVERTVQATLSNRVNVMDNLVPTLKKMGMEKKQIKTARSMVRQAANELGIQLD